MTTSTEQVGRGFTLGGDVAVAGPATTAACKTGCFQPGLIPK